MQESDCQWLLREQKYVHENNNIHATGLYTGRLFCMYTCCETKSKPKTKFVDVSCCPHLSKIDNHCPLIELARELESYYINKHQKEQVAKEEAILSPRVHSKDKLDEVARLLDGK